MAQCDPPVGEAPRDRLELPHSGYHHLMNARALLVPVLSAAIFLGACGSEESVSPGLQPPDADAGVDAVQDDVGAEAAVESGAEAATEASFSVEQSFSIASVLSGHLAFPDLTRLADGRLLLVYRQGASHVDSTGKIMKQLGTADGLTWTDPEVLYDEPGTDDRDPSVTTLPDGSVLVTYFQYRILSVPDGTLAVHHCFAGRSQDNGATFGAFAQIDPGAMDPPSPVLDAQGHWVDANGEPITVQGCSSAAVEWNGKLVLPTYGGQSLNQANMAASPKSRIWLYESSDSGSTWTGSVAAADLAPDHWLEEPALLVLDDGRALMHWRTASGASPGNPGRMMQVGWDDGAGAWTGPTEFSFVGHAPELAQLSSGLVLSGFRELNDTYTHEYVSFVWSLDRGATWSEPVRVKDCGTSECGYPAIEDLGDSRFLLVYYAPGGKAIDAVVYRVELK